MQRFIDFFTALGQHPNRVNDFVAAASADPALAAKLAAAVDADDNRAALRLMADQQWSRAPGREAPAPAAPSGSRSPMSFEDRLLNDPNIRKSIEESGQAYPAGNAEAVMEAMRRGPVQKRGRPKKATAEDSIRELIPPAPSPRQMELPLGEEPTGMIPYGVRGPGVPHGGLMGPGTIFDSGARGMVPAPMRGLPAPGPTGMVPRSVTDASPREYRVVDEVPPTGGLRQLAGAAAAGLGAAAGVRMGLDALGPTEPEANADLVAESRPGPSVGVTDEVPEPTTLQAPRDYSMEARALINRLNDMRRAAGGEVPEAPAMMQEVNRLLAMGNQTRQATYAAAPQDDPSRMFQQAQGLIDQVNQMYRQGMSPNSPEVQRIMAQVRQLQAQGDAIRNRRAG